MIESDISIAFLKTEVQRLGLNTALQDWDVRSSGAQLHL